MTDLVQLNVPGISPALNAKVREAMDECACSRNEIVVAVLAREFRVRFRPQTRHTTSTAVNPAEWHLKMPLRLRKKIKARAVREDTTSRDLVVEVLSEHFGVPFAPVVHTKRRRESWKRKEAA